jgi:FixJ family two-component response regulator
MMTSDRQSKLADRYRQASSDLRRVSYESEETVAQLEEVIRESRTLTEASLRRGIIHIVDDDHEFVTAISRLLRAAGYVTRSYRSAEEILSAPFDGPGCLLLDVRLPGFNGLDLQKALASRADPMPIIFLSGYGDIPTSVQAMKAGAVDFLTKPVPRDALLEGIRKAMMKDREGRTAREEARKWCSLFGTLTPREREVLERVVIGRLNKQIAAELGITERTVKAHRGQIMTKMRVDSVARLVHIADQLARQKHSSARPNGPC